MWEASVEHLGAGRIRRYVPRHDRAPLSYGDAIRRWREDATFRSFCSALLADAPFPAYRWETPQVTEATLGRTFEFVLLDAPALDRAADPDAFAEHFQDSAGRPTPETSVVTFPNLGNDAVLVVPRGDGPAPTYVHLGAFVRGAADAQKHALWRAVGTAVQSRLGPRPLWLSTAGAGVAWLHVRLDSRPKYYGYTPYAQDSSR